MKKLQLSHLYIDGMVVFDKRDGQDISDNLQKILSGVSLPACCGINLQ
jgi:hypothetical protein